jgi:quercetin dioxygenase-like cupin family protein
MEPKLVRHAEGLAFTGLPGLCRRTLAWGERIMLLENTFEPGAEMSTHSHPHEQITYVVSGEIDILLEEETYHLEPGDSLLLPSNCPHGVRTSKGAVVIDVFAPPRVEFT